jgi:HSP20 family protein
MWRIAMNKRSIQHADVNSIIDGFNNTFNNLFETFNTYTVPESIVLKTETGFLIEVVAPGLKKSDFKVTVERNKLVVSCHIEKSNSTRSYQRSFTRFWDIGPVDTSLISVKYEDGILRIDVPSNKSCEKNITIDVK